MHPILQHLALLRQAMKSAGVAACIVPGTDPHASEYNADFWKERDWISGFDGSAGTVAVSLENAGLWTDSRYFLQAEKQLEGTTIRLMKMGLPETPGINPWLISVLKPGDKVAVNPQMFSVNAFASMKSELGKYGIELYSIDLFAGIWTDRPAIPQKPVFLLPTKYSGKSSAEKIESIRKVLQNNLADVFIMTALDDIVWLFNVRGGDVPYNPVIIAYALIMKDKAIIYLDKNKISPEIQQYFDENNIEVRAYLQIEKDIEQLDAHAGVWVDGAKLNQSLFDKIPKGCTIINQMSPVFKMKSIKNDTEIAGFRNAMIKDGIALTRFFIWLEENIPAGKVTELNIAEKLREYRSQQDLYHGESFGTIAGFADHGAMNHYKADEKSSYTITPDNILLIDSGGQYFDGTTDITRTISTGNPTPMQKLDYTLVLKGHIGLATIVFPAGTRGSQLDILARKAMWVRRMNYGHGTGHGIGHFLNVHEGPQNIRAEENPVVLEPGMIISNEPGMYRDGIHGFRTENLILVTEDEKTDFGRFLKFETLTLFPIETNLIEMSLMTEDEIIWLNDYHQMVYDRISPSLTASERKWLSEKTRVL